MRKSIAFYTEVLDFKLNDPQEPEDSPVVALVNDEAVLFLTSLDGDQKPGIAAGVLVKDVDNLFHKYLTRGLDVSTKIHSPVHQQPVNQTWGNREFYVTDPDGNTLRFIQPL